MMSLKICIALLFLVICVNSGNGATYFASLRSERTEYGTVTKYCDYHGMKLAIGSKFKDMERCDDCRCSKDGLSCASMAHSVSVIGESECENVVASCRNKWVFKSDPTKKCPKRLIPKEMSMVGK